MALALLSPLAITATASAVDNTSIINGLCAGTALDATDPAHCNPNDPQAIAKINDIIHLIINLLSLLVGVIAVIMIIIGGLKYIISSGDSSNVSSAKNTIIYALVGLVIVALAQFMVRFVLAKVTST
jgi:hypothetical protein